MSRLPLPDGSAVRRTIIRNRRRLLSGAAGLLAVAAVAVGYQVPALAPWFGFAAHPTDPAVAYQKTVWDWLGLLVIPLALAVFGYLLAGMRTRADRRIADEALRETALQTYIDHLAALLLDNALRGAAPNPAAAGVARIRTMTILRRLEGDPERRGTVLQFLHEAGLIQGDPAVIGLAGADLREIAVRDARLAGAALARTDLGGAVLWTADLTGADLREALLYGAQLSGARLTGAHLAGARLNGALLRDADLSGVDLRAANLANADLSGARLAGADLTGAGFHNALLRNADLQGAQVDLVRLEQQARSLWGALLPDGRRHG